MTDPTDRFGPTQAGEPIEGGRVSLPARGTAGPGPNEDGRRNTGDLVATIILLIPLGIITCVGVMSGLLILGASSCYSSCNPGLVVFGALFAAVVALVVGVLGFVFAIRRLSVGEPALWIPLLAFLGILIVVTIAPRIASAGVG